MSNFVENFGKFLLYGQFGIYTFIYVCILITGLYIILGKKYDKYTAKVISIEPTIIDGRTKYNILLSINNKIQTFTNRNDLPKNLKPGDIIEVYMISTELYFENPTKMMIVGLVFISIVYIVSAFIFYKVKNDQTLHKIYAIDSLLRW